MRRTAMPSAAAASWQPSALVRQAEHLQPQSEWSAQEEADPELGIIVPQFQTVG